MIPDTNGKPESRASDAEELETLLAIELAQKKMEWAAATERYRKLRTASFVFLALVIIGAMVGLFLAFSYLSMEKPNRSNPAAGENP